MPDRIYTRRGDDGTTQLLFGGKDRLPKSDPRPSAYGEVDESVAALGVARAEAHVAGEDELAELILRVQRELFVVGAELATAPDDWERLTPGVSQVTQEMVDRLETDIDSLRSRFEMPKDFVVAGETRLGAALDLARAVLRRAERAVVRLSLAEPVRGEVLAYVNRLADLAWAMERFAERSENQPRPRED